MTALLAILLDGPLDTDGRDAKSLGDVRLLAVSITDELRSEHPERVAIITWMRKDGQDTGEVGPRVVFVDDTDAITKGSGPIRDEW